MTDAQLVLRILPRADVDAVLVNNRRGDEIAAFPFASQLVFRLLGIAVELPQELAVLGIERVDPAIAAGKDDLRLVVDDGVGGIGPLTVLDEHAAIDEALEERFVQFLL